MTNTNMALDDADTIQRFITQMKVQTENSNPTETHEPEKPMTPPPIDPDHLTSPGAHPKPSPHISGLTAPYNTPHLTAAQIHNQNVADAFSDYVNAMDGRPLSESIWAPAAGFVRHVPSTPHGARSALGLTRSKAVEPNSATNESFARMSFKAADPVDSAGKKWSSDRSANAIFPHVSPSFGPDTPASTDMVKKENEAPAKSKGYLPPHLRATRVSSPKSDAITRAPAHDKSNSSDQNLVSSESPVKTKTSLPDPEGFSSKVTSNFSNPSPIKNTVQDTITKITTGPAGAKPSTDTSAAGEDLEHKTFFTSWPKLEERTRPAAKVRKVIIKDLPRGSTATFVASLVYGGSIEEISIRSSAAGDLSAVIRFMDAGECMKFYEETSNGLVYEKDAKGRELVLFVELSKDVDVVGGLLQGWIASGVTRCVRAVGVEADWGMDGLVKIAERKNRKVEKIVDGQNPGGARSVVFRFCKVEDAVQFKAAISRDEEWEHCNILYTADPCATATGVHFEG